MNYWMRRCIPFCLPVMASDREKVLARSLFRLKWRPGFLLSTDASSASDEGYEEQYDKDEEQDLGDTCGTGCDTEESECACNEGNDEEDECPA